MWSERERGYQVKIDTENEYMNIRLRLTGDLKTADEKNQI